MGVNTYICSTDSVELSVNTPEHTFFIEPMKWVYYYVLLRVYKWLIIISISVKSSEKVYPASRAAYKGARPWITHGPGKSRPPWITPWIIQQDTPTHLVGLQILRLYTSGVHVLQSRFGFLSIGTFPLPVGFLGICKTWERRVRWRCCYYGYIGYVIFGVDHCLVYLLMDIIQIMLEWFVWWILWIGNSKI